jgi:hypothetical protein
VAATETGARQRVIKFRCAPTEQLDDQFAFALAVHIGARQRTRREKMMRRRKRRRYPHRPGFRYDAVNFVRPAFGHAPTSVRLNYGYRSRTYASHVAQHFRDSHWRAAGGVESLGRAALQFPP